MMNFNKFKSKEILMYYLLTIILSIILFFYNKAVGLIGILITIYIAFLEWKIIAKKEKDLKIYIESLNEQFDEITRRAIFTTPFSLLVVNKNGKIIWHNSKFKDILGDTSKTYINENINTIFKDINIEDIIKDTEYIEFSYNNNFYRFYINYFADEKEGDSMLFYGVDYTEEFNLKNSILNNSLATVWINIDNYSEIYNNTEEIYRPNVFAKIDKTINKLALDYEGYSIKYEQENYIIAMTYENLKKLMATKFSILDEVRSIDKGNKIPPTLSIGVGTRELTPVDNYKSARACIDIALGRGGDQVVVKIGDHFEYFGGKKQSVAKTNKVKARVMANALERIIEQGNDLFIMGHKNPDMDSIGSCLGIMELAKILNKKSYIILEKVTPAIEKIYRAILEKYPDENIRDIFIKPEEAKKMLKSDSLVVILDHHRKSHSECPELLDMTDKVILIDHHRRGGDYITNTVITYLEPYASSTSELVTEILYYTSEKLKIPKIVAEGLLAGITVDTKNFTIQTGVRTFEAASILKRQGADSIVVKQFFKDSANTVKLKSEVVSKAHIYRDKIAIGFLDEEVTESILIAAQSADELLTMEKVEASFVLVYKDKQVHISGRSLGDISVQLILEKLGGGGHLTSAGVQLDTKMEDAIEKLKEVIDEYLEEDNSESNINR